MVLIILYSDAWRWDFSGGCICSLLLIRTSNKLFETYPTVLLDLGIDTTGLVLR